MKDEPDKTVLPLGSKFHSSTARKWVGLTDAEKEAIYRQAEAENWHDQPLLEAVEAKLREKNGVQE
jgi:hypothetical protein